MARASYLTLPVCKTIVLGLYYEVIQAFANEPTRKIWDSEHGRHFGPDLQRIAQKTLRLLNAAETINDTRIPPSNRLAKVTGDREGQYSIRINDQFRIWFVWTTASPTDVQVVNCH